MAGASFEFLVEILFPLLDPFYSDGLSGRAGLLSLSLDTRVVISEPNLKVNSQ